MSIVKVDTKQTYLLGYVDSYGNVQVLTDNIIVDMSDRISALEKELKMFKDLYYKDSDGIMKVISDTYLNELRKDVDEQNLEQQALAETLYGVQKDMKEFVTYLTNQVRALSKTNDVMVEDLSTSSSASS